MSIELKINDKSQLNAQNQNIKSVISTEQDEDNIQKKKILEQKYKIDIIDAFGANTSDKLDNPINFITHNNYIIYNVGYHILIKDFPPNYEELLSEKEVNKQSKSFFIYLSDNLKEITSLSVSEDKNYFTICEELENEDSTFSTITMYSLSNINIETFYIIDPTRKIITDKYYNFKSINFSDDNKYLCAFCNEKISQKIYAIVYNIEENREFILNETQPYIIIDLLSKIEIKNININDINNYKSFLSFTKISFDKNNILCTSGNNNLNFWYFLNSKYKKIPNLIDKRKNFLDHAFYKFKNNINENQKNSILITITSINELIIFQSSQKTIKEEQNNKTNTKSGTKENGILYKNIGIEQFVIKYYITNIFNDINCISTKLNIINDTDYFNGIIIGNNLGDIVFYEKTKKDDINNLEYIFLKKIEKNNNKSKCTSITLNYDKTLICISYEKSEISYCYLKNIFPKIRNGTFTQNFNIINDGFHNYPLLNFDVSIQRPILITSSLKDNKIKIWNFASGNSEYCKIKLPEGLEYLNEKFIINCFALHPNGYIIALANEEMIWFFHICHKEIRFYGNEINEISNNNSKNTKKRVFLQKRNDCYILKFSNGGNKLLAVNTSKNVFIISTFTRKIINCFHLNHFGKINDIIISSDDVYLYSFGSDGCIYEVNIITENMERIISTNINYIQGFFLYTFNKNINKEIDSNSPEKFFNVLACGYNAKQKFSITEIIYVPISENKDSKEHLVVSSEMSYLSEKITCIIEVKPKKIEKRCIICGTQDGKIILFSSPFKDAEYKWDEVKTHNGRINKLEYISDLNMIISCGDDGNIFLYSLYEILGQTVLYNRNDNIYLLNTTLDITLGNSVLFPISELEKIEINKNEEKEIEEKFQEEKERMALEHKINLSKIITNMNLKFEEEKKDIRKKIELLKDKLDTNRVKFENELEKKDKELVDKLSKDIKDNSNSLYRYRKQIKELKEKIKINTEKYREDIIKKREDYKKKFEEVEKGFNDKINILLKEQKELKDKYTQEKKDKKAFIKNIEKESILENELRNLEQNERDNKYKYNYGNLTYDIFKYRDLIEKLEKNIKNKKKEFEELENKVEYLEKVLDKNREDNAQLLYDKEKITDEFKELLEKMQKKETNEEFNNKLRVELYKQKYEFSSKFNEKSIENKLQSKANKSLAKNINNLTNIVISYDKERSKALFNLEITKKENDRLRQELNISTQNLDIILQKIFQSFQTHSKGEIIKCLYNIYKKYVTESFIIERQKKLLDKNIVVELESQINTLEAQININKSHIKQMENSHDKYKEEKIKENSLLLSDFKNNRLRSQSLAKSITKLKGHSKLLSTEMNKLKKESSILSSNEPSKELKKNISTTSEAFPPINFYKFKNTSSVLPSSIIKADNEENNSISKKGSFFFSKSNESKRHSSDGLSAHTSFDEEKNLFS